MQDPTLFEIDGQVARITLNRPEATPDQRAEWARMTAESTSITP